MDPILLAILQSWEIRPEVILILVSAGIIYTVGWLRLRARSHSGRRHIQDELA